MAKYDAMLAKNKKINTEKEQLALRMIHAMADADEQVTIRKLMKRTGLSRSMFYHNAVVRSAVNEAKRKQLGNVYAREEQIVIYKAMQQQEEILKRKLAALQAENERLKKILQDQGLLVLLK